MTDPMRARVLGPKDGNAGMLGSMGVRFMLAGEETGGGFALVEHPMPPRALAAPLHRHSVRTSTALSSRDALARFLATRSCTESQAI